MAADSAAAVPKGRGPDGPTRRATAKGFAIGDGKVRPEAIAPVRETANAVAVIAIAKAGPMARHAMATETTDGQGRQSRRRIRLISR